MRTTIDLPEDLLRRAKATAALRGVKMKDLIADFVRSGLSSSPTSESGRYGMNGPIPVTIPATVLTLKPLSNEEIDAILLQEDLEKIQIA